MKIYHITKTIVSKTILFVFILVFISIYKRFIGHENTLVAVTVLVELMVLLGKDLTKSPVKNTGKLLATSLILVFASYFADINIYLGIILNLFVITGIGYYYSDTMTKELIVPFGLQYLFMLYSFVEGELLLRRILGLIGGVVVIMVVQFLLHRVFKKQEKALENDSSTDLLEFEDKKLQTKIRIRYAFRVGILSSVVIFLVAYFHISEGRWIVYTIFSLTELYSEQCKVRAKQRLFGTLLGVVVVVALFILIKDNNLRFLILLSAGYLNCYFSNYKDIMVFTTVSAVMSEAIAEGSIAVAFLRISYVAIGTALALLANHFLFRAPEKL